MQARETPNSAGLYKNKNCAFPLNPSLKLFFFFYLRFLSQTQAIQQAKGGNHPYSLISFAPSQEDPDVYFAACI